MKIVRKIFFYLFLSIIVIVVTASASVLFFKDRIIRQFITEANKNLLTPVKIGTINVSAWASFPNVAIVFRNVYVEDSHKEMYPLFTASRIAFSINPIEMWRGNYNISGVRIDSGEVSLKINHQGVNNYTIFAAQAGSTGSIKFDLRNVDLRHSHVRYTDLEADEDFDFSGQQINASISSSENVYAIEAKGDVTTNEITIGTNTWVKDKTAFARTTLIYDDNTRHLQIEPSTLSIHGSDFLVNGEYSWKGKNLLDLTTIGKETTIQTLLSILPENSRSRLEEYRSEGEVIFTMKIKGPVGGDGSPALTAEFGCNNATIYHPELKTTLKNVNLEGSFATPKLSDLHQAVLSLKNFNGKLNNDEFHANLVMHDMIDPEVKAEIKGTFDLAALLNFYPVKFIQNPAGRLVADVAFSGKLSSMKNKSTAKQSNASGEVTMEDIFFTYGDRKIPFDNLNGGLHFTNNDLAMKEVSGKLGNSDFLLNGVFKNIITFLLFENQPIGIETDLHARNLDLDQLFSYGFGGEDNKNEYVFAISPNLNLNFNCDVGKLNYRRFRGTNIKGDLLIKNQLAVARKISMNTMGGQLGVSGIVDAKNPVAIDVVNTFKIDGLHLDSIFYVFENFNQTFIQDKHLKGQAKADINMEMTLNQHLHLFPETLVADIGVVIIKGQLNNFTPMQKLDKYLDDQGLDHLVFADLHNDIHIEKKTVYIPQMEVRSNVTAIRITGTHTFDQQIDYRVVAPLINRKVNVKEAADAFEIDQAGRPKLFLKITGTADDYKVQYDAGAVKNKIANDIKKEAQELKEAFHTKGEEKKKELELSDETFDWDP